MTPELGDTGLCVTAFDANQPARNVSYKARSGQVVKQGIEKMWLSTSYLLPPYES
jgi:hypothetical protein